jgi:hypothetical protein
MLVEREQQYRTMLWLVLDPATPRESLVLRRGRAIGRLEDALSPLRTRLSRKELPPTGAVDSKRDRRNYRK